MTNVENLAQALLRESAYNVFRFKAEGRLGEDYSRAMGLYRDACKLVREVFGPEAEEMIEQTWSVEDSKNDDSEEDIEPDDEPWDGFRSDAEADADTLASAGWGTDEDYGYYGEDDGFYD